MKINLNDIILRLKIAKCQRKLKRIERKMRDKMMDMLAENICNNNNVIKLITSVERNALTRLLNDMDISYDTYVDELGFYNVIFEKDITKRRNKYENKN
jgi:hypothetical protein